MANILKPLPKKDQEYWNNYFTVPVAWNPALNALRYSIPRWKYFALSNPPNDIDKRNFYEDVQYSIKNYAEQLTKTYGSRDTKDIRESIKRHISINLYDAVSQESKLFTSIKDKPSWAKSYSNLIENSKKFVKEKQKSRIANQDSIDFWTRTFYGRLEGNDVPITDKDAFVLLILSFEFYDDVRAKGMSSGIFSRRAALRYGRSQSSLEKDVNKFQKALDKIDSKISREALLVLYDSYNNFIEENIIGGTEEKDYIKQMLLNAMDSAMSNYFQMRKDGKGIARSAFKGKGQLASSVSKTIRDKIQTALKDAQKEAEKNSLYRIDNFDYSIQLGDENDVFFSVSAEHNTSAFYQAKGKDLKDEEFVQDFFTNFKNIAVDFRNKYNYSELNLRKSLGKIKISDLINSNNNKKLDFHTFLDKAINFINSGEVFYFFRKSYQTKGYWKSFNVANSNTFLTGLFGELAGVFTLSTAFQARARLTGSAFSVFGESKGQSVNDLRIKTSTGDTIGVNVKNYMFNDTTLTLYGDETNYSIANQALNKYLTSEDRQIIQFAVENSGYFAKEAIQKIGTQISMYHFPEFIRVFDHTRGSRKNLFFNLNGVIYPLSYIYLCILNELDEIKNKEQLQNIFMKVSVVNYNSEPFMYSDLGTARENWSEEQFRLTNIKKSTKTDLLLQPKGLKVNLVSLSLFS